MSYGAMNLQELACFVGIDQRRLERMAQRGEIPSRKVGGQIRFNRAEITEWLQQRMGSLNGNHLADMDASITAHRQIAPQNAIVTPLLHIEGVTTSLAARTKNSVLKELVALANETQLVYDADALLEALKHREELRSTALEAGIAMPHPRRPLPYAVAETILVVAHTTGGIGFGAPDGGLTDLFFMTCSQDDRHHLHILARLCRMLNNSQLAQDLRRATKPQEIIALIRARELEVVADTP